MDIDGGCAIDPDMDSAAIAGASAEPEEGTGAAGGAGAWRNSVGHSHEEVQVTLL